MADQTVHLAGVGKIEALVLPAIADVAGGAARLVAVDADAVGENWGE